MMEIKIDNRVAIGIGLVVAAIVGYQEYTAEDGLLNGLNNSQQPQVQAYGPQNTQASPYGPQYQHPNPPPMYHAQPDPNGPNGYPNQQYGPEGAYGPSASYDPNGGYPPSGPQGPYGPSQNGYGPSQSGYGPSQDGYTSSTYEVDLGEPTEEDGW